MNTLRYHILFILFIAIAFSTGCDSNTASQNNNNLPQDTVFLASEFKKAIVKYRNVIMKSGELWSYEKSYRYRSSDGTKVYALSIYTNSTAGTDPTIGNTSFSGYYLKNSSEISEFDVSYYLNTYNGSTHYYSLTSISLEEIPFVYQQDSSIHLLLNGTEAQKYINTIMDSNYYHQYPGWHREEIEERSYHRFDKCTDSTQIEVILQR